MELKKSKPAIQKKHFLLLEVLISISLVLMVLGPIVTSFYQIRKAEYARIAHLTMERNARLIMAGLKAKLYSNQWDWEALKEGFSEEEPNLAYTVTYEFHYVDHCDKKSAHAEYLVVDCILTMKDKKSGKMGTFTFPLLLERRENA